MLEPTRGAGPTGGSLGAFVGALPNDAHFDFSAEAVRRSLDESLARLGLDRIEIAYVHDPDDDFAGAAGGALFGPACVARAGRARGDRGWA